MDVIDFPRDKPTVRVDAPARAAVLTAVDGSPISTHSDSVQELLSTVKGLPHVQQPASTQVGGTTGTPTLVMRFLLQTARS
jgi:hypothetical protein